MDRERALNFLRKMGDAYLVAANDAGIEPWELYDLLHNSVVHGAHHMEQIAGEVSAAIKARLGDSNMINALDHLHEPEVEEQILEILSPVVDAAIQVATASSIMLELLPLPQAETIMLNFMAFRERTAKAPN